MKQTGTNVPNLVTLEIGEHTFRFGERTYIMGILNVTPDSFSDGGDYTNIDLAVTHAKEMIADGADIIDIGGESTRPGFEAVTAKEEMNRVIPVIERLRRETNTVISLDTTKSSVVFAGIQAGAHIINDIWGLQGDPDIAVMAGKFDMPVIAMHNQDGTEYEGDMIDSMMAFFEETIKIAEKAGIEKNKLILDPGIGFGKDFEQNVIAMRHLQEFRDIGYPILLGTSRKSLIAKILEVPPKERVSGTVATTVLGITHGVDIVRVHDVKENMQAAKVTDYIVRG